MNRNLTKALAYLAIPAAVFITAMADAEPHAGAGARVTQSAESGKSGSESRHMQLMQRLGVSPEQSTKMRAVMEQGKSQSKALHQELQGKRQAFMQYIQTADAKETQAQSMLNQMNDLQRRMSELRLKTWFRMRQLLTPQQQQQMEQLRRDRPRMGVHPGSGGERRTGKRFGTPSGQHPRGIPGQDGSPGDDF